MKGTTLRRFKDSKPDGHGVVLSVIHPAHRYGRTLFPSRVFEPTELPRLLKSGYHARKIGKQVQKGRWRGWPIFTLTLEERATCPRSCAVWASCYGNNMQAAERIVGGADLEALLWNELAALQREHPAGFAVRLHILGDFYSVGYVDLWRRALAAFPALHVFGFTAHDPAAGEIGAALFLLTNEQWDRFAVRFSGLGGGRMASQIVPDHHPDAIVCPAQRGLTDCCATCALCWHSDVSIAFLRH